MKETSQTRALRNYRERLTKQGMARFEVLGRAADRELIRQLARRLAEDGQIAENLRAQVKRELGALTGKTGRILAALRRSPLVGAGLELERERARERKVSL